ncbi:hypothetical protein [Blastococcus haudaquaticus]|uniref:hypothetical protein n=1 Tax=Blastococcus haudaquaticus TaxID=1938745 RepID=UPI001177400C|nr:hypothetical protein [Blastococcus haudaquaticus]
MYGVLYVVVEMVGYHLEQVGWADISPLDVATAVTDALLTVAVCAAVLLALDLGRKRWGTSVAAWHSERGEHQAEIWDEPIEVRSWRPAPLAITAERVDEPPQQPRYRGNPYSFAGHRFPRDRGRLL